MAAEWQVLLQQEYRIVLAILILIVGGIAGYLLGRLNMRILRAAGLHEVVEGTPFERTARSLGTTTVSLIARLTSWFIYGVTILLALNTAELPLSTQLFWQIILFTPQLFVAALVFIIGFIVADKAELLVSERLRSVKLPEVNVIPRIVKYSIVYIASLIALSQIGIAVMTLLVLFGAYVVAAIVFGAVAFWDLLRSSAAGIYLLLNQPYGIGDEIRVAGNQGIVQEVDLFVTHIENDGEEFIIPNHLVFRKGAVRLRN
ncbi:MULTISPECIES: mechanosensitive ion channel domain-containing protein [unclassified Haladaptatus]|uniref:mechanosensitive ion channel family protein n=1 Tax=unclassified Haladaptatus TaxID=2622732 RepID=UPI00209C3986|nr:MULTISPECIES: mechanosensitive ion channel domain-containing protein [unclassified Haladaptatus]MCO8246977.1 mechanosensitive ion channel [Haladaptatus sp. AB643]MCO8254640.1 mechanosensitive ion channel [Haladaptatus sp. AB618]